MIVAFLLALAAEVPERLQRNDRRQQGAREGRPELVLQLAQLLLDPGQQRAAVARSVVLALQRQQVETVEREQPVFRADENAHARTCLGHVEELARDHIQTGSEFILIGNTIITSDKLRADFGDALVERMAWQGEVTLDEGPGHQGKAHVTRFVGQAR